MCRSSSPLFGDPNFPQFSRDEFERGLRRPRAFRPEGKGSGVLMSADAEARLVLDGRDGRYKHDGQPRDVLVTRASILAVAAWRETIRHEPLPLFTHDSLNRQL